jgi:hypothetical protein
MDVGSVRAVIVAALTTRQLVNVLAVIRPGLICTSYDYLSVRIHETDLRGSFVGG